MYADSLSVAAARDVYFANNGFTAASYTDPWVKLSIGPIPFAFPNTAGRKAAVKLHDLHHVATGYATTWTGEGEIGSWELAAGCGRHWAAWWLNTSVLATGLALSPRRMFRAFVRGRHSKSLYHREFGDDLLQMTVGDLRSKLGLDREPPRARGSDVAAFVGWVGIALGLTAAMLVPFALLLWWLVF